MANEVNDATLKIQPMEISVLKVGNKQMTISVFNQLYEEKPYNQEFEIVAELWGKVNRGDDFVVFKTERGVRKFNCKHYYRELPANALGESIAKALDNNEHSFELNHFRRQLLDFYNDQKWDLPYSLETALDLITCEPRYRVNRDFWVDFERSLSGEFREAVEKEYQKGLDLLAKRNSLVPVFAQLQQLFIAV